MRSYFRYLYNPEPKDRSEKIIYLLYRGLMTLVATAVFVVVAILVGLAFDTGHEPSRSTILVIIGGYASYRFVHSVVFWNILAPDAPSHRLINMTDDEAKGLHRDLAIVAAVAIAALGMCVWMDALGLSRNAPSCRS